MGIRWRASVCSTRCSARRAGNPLVLGGDVHTFYATELRLDFNRPASRANPVLATEFVGTSVTSSSRPQQRTAQYVAMNPHIKYGRSDKRGYMLMEMTPKETRTRFMGLDEVRDPKPRSASWRRFGWRMGRRGWRLLCDRRPRAGGDPSQADAASTNLDSAKGAAEAGNDVDTLTTVQIKPAASRPAARAAGSCRRWSSAGRSRNSMYFGRL